MVLLPEMEGYVERLRVLHWVMAAMLTVMLITGFISPQLSDMSAVKWWIRDTHESIGLLLFPLFMMRCWFRLSATTPDWNTYSTSYIAALSRSVHGSFYLLMLALPISGYLTSHPYGIQFFGVYVVNYLPNAVSDALLMKGDPDFALAGHAAHYHKDFAIVLCLLIALHVTGAFKIHTKK
ncbi:cytochrome b [Enterovibrio calviensis]|uniref:cytochrome b n=1 Tax=Enterovibrio calviensis TaxID=91359 RepID=UPI000488B027|nr:cytochrome b/b6 domain-containing protein [Enterovibrio calviensis]